MNKLKKRGAFTLIELLAVVLILGILMAIVIPAVMKAISNSEKTAVKKEVVAIERSIAGYMTKYGCFPDENNLATDRIYPTSKPNTFIINNLTGTNTTLTTLHGNPMQNNAERIRFMEFDEARYKSTAGYYDIWNQSYYIALDTNNDNQLNITFPSGGGTVILKGRRIAVWSEGDPSESPKKRITSWD
ncbi:MAG: type II secretion system protein [Kiritimatiellia bacterium]